MANRVIRSPSAFRSNAPRRKTLWTGTTGVTTHSALAAGAAFLAFKMGTDELALRPFTIVRTVGYVSVWSDQTAAFEAPFGAVGHSVVSEQASAIGVTAVPTPITDIDSDAFFTYTPFSGSGSSQAASQSNGRATVQFDSKAMRKVEDGDDIVTVIENGNAGAGLFFVIMFRQLLKLH